MALIVPSGGLISQVNGTVDGKVYYRGRWGNTVRAWVNPTNTITPQRTAVRNLFASLQALFNSLTPDMQDDWNKFAEYQRKFNRLAQPYIPTGLQVFMERNMNLAMYGAGPLLLPPDEESELSIISTTVTTLTAASFILTASFFNNPTLVPAGYHWLIYGTNNQSPGRNFMTNRFRIMASPAPGASSTQSVLFSWSGAWTPSVPIVGKKIFFKSVLVNDNTGKASQPAYCSKIIS